MSTKPQPEYTFICIDEGKNIRSNFFEVLTGDVEEAVNTALHMSSRPGGN